LPKQWKALIIRKFVSEDVLDAYLLTGQNVDLRIEKPAKNHFCTCIPNTTVISLTEIDMDFMNLNQSAHGDREFGFICSRMKIKPQGRSRTLARAKSMNELAIWMREAAACRIVRLENRPLRR
jgi:L-arabinose isomerase